MRVLGWLSLILKIFNFFEINILNILISNVIQYYLTILIYNETFIFTIIWDYYFFKMNILNLWVINLKILNFIKTNILN